MDKLENFSPVEIPAEAEAPVAVEAAAAVALEQVEAELPPKAETGGNGDRLEVKAASKTMVSLQAAPDLKTAPESIVPKAVMPRPVPANSFE